MNEIKVGVVGLGLLGELHINQLQNEIAGVRVVSVCDIFEKRVDEIKKKYDIPNGYTDYDKMLADGGIDAVFIITNVQAHKNQIIKACEAGLNIFVEKPLSLDVNECDEIAEAVKKNSGKVFMIAHMRRFDPSYAAAKEAVDRGEIGDVIMFKSTSLDAAVTLEVNVPKALSGAFHPWFYEMGIHDTDLARWFIGSEIKEAYATGGCYVAKELEQVDDYDNGFGLATFENGSCAYIHVGKTAASCHVEAEIIGTKGTLKVNSIPRKNRVELLKDGKATEDLIFDFYERWGEAYRIEKIEFLNCIREGRQSGITVEDGTRSLEIANILHESYMKKELVKAESSELNKRR